MHLLGIADTKCCVLIIIPYRMKHARHNKVNQKDGLICIKWGHSAKSNGIDENYMVHSLESNSTLNYWRYKLFHHLTSFCSHRGLPAEFLLIFFSTSLSEDRVMTLWEICLLMNVRWMPQSTILDVVRKADVSDRGSLCCRSLCCWSLCCRSLCCRSFRCWGFSC